MLRLKQKSMQMCKALKGDISISGIVKFLGTLGYDVIFFTADEYDGLIAQYGVELTNTKAITYCGSTRVVFIDDSLCGADKLHLLLHECGHILLGHIEENQIHSIDSIQTENEAEVFTYQVLNYKNRIMSRSALISSAVVLAGTALICYIGKRRRL